MSKIRKKNNFKDLIVILFLLTPILSRWLLPVGIENHLTKSILYIPIYIPNLLILLFIFNGVRNKKNNRLKILFGLHILFCTIGFLVNDYNDKFAFFWVSSYYFYAMFLALNFKITEGQRRYMRRFFFFTLIILTIQIILFSLGILVYSLDITSGGHDFAGVFRISTTVGAATGTSGIIFLLGILVFYLYGKTFFGYSSLIITLVSLLLLMSRGGIAAMVLFSIFYFWNDIRKSFKSFLTILLSIVIIFIFIYQLGLLGPILLRMEIAESSQDITSGRTELIESTLKSLDKSGNYLFGVGSGNVYSSKDIKTLEMKSKYSGAPHNSFVLIYVEQGLIGIFLFVIFWVFLLYSVRANKVILYSLFSFVLVLLNTETIFITDSEYVFFISIFIMVGLDNNKNLKKYII